MIDEENLALFIQRRIKTLRERAGYNVNSFAYRTGISQSYLRDLELGLKSNISVEKLYQICSELNITFTEFFDESFVPKAPDPLETLIRSMSKDQRDSLYHFLTQVNL